MTAANLTAMWHPLLGRPNTLFPDLNWTPAIELRIAHARWDRASRHPAAPGGFVDRHVAPGRSLVMPPVRRDSLDVFADPATGVGVSLASGPGGPLHDPADPRTRHQLDWDFLAMHLRRAIARYEAAQPLPALHEWRTERSMTTGEREWHLCEAIARYVVEWKNRTADGPFDSPHPVDVLLHSHHCAGTANLACALAHVAGIPARRISTSSHSTVEFLVAGRWMWSDNIRGGALLHHGSYQEYLADLDRAVFANPTQQAHHVKSEVFYRAPYDVSASRWWRFGSGCPVPSAGGAGDAAAGFGLSVHHDPATATALYPGQDQRLFAGDPGGRPWLTIGAKGGWLHAPVALAGGLAVRRRFFVSDCADNPITDGELRVWVDGEGGGLQATCDGVALTPLGMQPQRHLHRAAVFAVPARLLTPGWHEFVVLGQGALVFFPDALDPYEAPLSAAGLRIDPAGVRTDPVWFPQRGQAATAPNASSQP